MKNVTAGVPQGSKLGPLLWFLYCNDIVKDIESEILMFPDDTCYFVSGQDPSETAVILNRDLKRIDDWSNIWKVTFNPGKSKDMIFSQRRVLSNSPLLIFNDIFCGTGKWTQTPQNLFKLKFILGSTISRNVLESKQETCSVTHCQISEKINTWHFVQSLCQVNPGIWSGHLLSLLDTASGSLSQSNPVQSCKALYWSFTLYKSSKAWKWSRLGIYCWQSKVFSLKFWFEHLSQNSLSWDETSDQKMYASIKFWQYQGPRNQY